MKKITLRITTLLLALLMLFSCVACQNKLGKPLMTLNKDGIKVSLSVNLYELMLSRMKGVLYQSGTTHQGIDVSSPLFWEFQDTFDGTNFETIDQFYCNVVLENCRTYLSILYLFEKHVGKLSDADQEALDEIMDELLATDGDGSMTKLNAVLANYGVNYDILRFAYELDYKTQALKDALYGTNASNVGDNFKMSFLEENYVHFRQIFLATEKNVYKTDEYKNDIYYYPNTHEKKGHICYDTSNGVKAKNEDGSDRLDAKGDVIYYVLGQEGKKIAYDTQTGVREPIFEGTAIKTTPMTDAEKAEVVAEKDALLLVLQGSTDEQFEQAIVDYLKEEDPDATISEFDDGIYLPKSVTVSDESEAIVLIVDALSKAEIGDVVAVQSATGWHIVKKYAHTEKAYEKEENEVYFESFVSSLTEKLLLDECLKLDADIVVDEKVLAKAPTMKDVAINGKYYYY